MSKICLCFIGLSLIISYNLVSPQNNDGLNFIEKAKRKLLVKEQNYLKKKPMSDHLKDFILRLKKDKLTSRLKRAEFNELNKLIDENQPANTASEAADSIFRSWTFKPSPVTARSLNDELPPENQNVLWNKFTFQPGTIEIPEVRSARQEQKKEAVDSIVDGLSNVLDNSPSPAVSPEVALPFVVTPGSAYESSREYLGRDQEEPDPDKEERQERTTDDSRVLGQILKDIEGLMEWKNEGKKRDNMICSIEGTWVSEIGGVNLAVSQRSPPSRKFNINVEDKMPPVETGFLCTGNWSIVGEMPFNNSGVVVVLAKHEKDKHIATFIGECRVCDSSETVTGTWLLGRSSRDCKDEKASHQVLSDVWKRENIKDLQTKHLRAITAKDLKP